MPLSTGEKDLFRRFTNDPEPEFVGWMRRTISNGVQKITGNQVSGDTGWQTLSLGTDWTATARTPQYRKDPFGKVTLRGEIIRSSTTYSLPSTLATLPAGYRIAQLGVHVVSGYDATDDKNYPRRVSVNTDGTIVFESGYASAAGTADNTGGAVNDKIALDSIPSFWTT